MRAVRVAGAGQVAVRDVPRPDPAAGEVLVDVVATAVCSTDRKLAGSYDGAAGGLTPGHEVTGWLPDGTPVGLYPEITCGTCLECQHGWQNRCPYRRSLGLARDGGLAEAVAVPTAQLVPLGGLDPVPATMLEPLACAVHAVAMCDVAPGTPTVVVGAGAMGVLCTWALQAAGARVAVCQRSLERRRLAVELGADAAVAPDGNPAQVLGEDPAVVVVSAPGAEPLRWALQRVAVGGLVHTFAGTPGGADVDANLVHYRHLRLVGSTGSRLQDYQRARDLVAGGQVALDRMPYQVVGLDGAPAALREGPPAGVLKTIVRCAAGEPEGRPT